MRLRLIWNVRTSLYHPYRCIQVKKWFHELLLVNAVRVILYLKKNWKCADCHMENAATKLRCGRCRARKSRTISDQQYSNEMKETEWKEVFDPTAKHLYYFNTNTGETQWERPLSMGPTPHASGWFGRGAAGSTAGASYERNNEQYLKRPARKQVEYMASKHTILENAYEYNIWYGRHVGGDFDAVKNDQNEPAETRCVLAKDAGMTKADKSTRNYGQTNFCLFFARGTCAMGKECRYFHRIPVRTDLERFAKDEAHDIFGRERHRDFKDDMTGVGAMTKPCRTLFVGNLVKSEYASPRELEEVLWRHFGEWGEVENINLISRLSIAFIRFRFRSTAEFAKEAMSNQALDHNEILNIRWAHEDPNPVATDAAVRADADALVELLQKRGVAVNDKNAEFDTPADYHLPPNKKPRLDDHHAYPDTDAQYNDWQPVVDQATGDTYWWNKSTDQTSRDAPAHVANANADRALAALDAADRVAAAATNKAAANSLQKSTENYTPSSSLPAGWATAHDTTNGQIYYYNTLTNQTSWQVPSLSCSDDD
mmetsp:Transcript_8539/g.13100  ORF Transcript_8539/g.13100 Transcript_8539/m.13100 type:complete len:541 (-) Transcript_8539:46-1668(-)